MEDSQAPCHFLIFFVIVHHTIQTITLACLIVCLRVYSCVSVGADGWEPSFPTGRTRITQYSTEAHRPQLSSGFPLTVKDLLLSGTPEPVSVSWLWWEFNSVGGDAAAALGGE